MGKRARKTHKPVPARDVGEEAETRRGDRRADAEAPAGEGRLGEEHDPQERQEEGEPYEEDVGA